MRYVEVCIFGCLLFCLLSCSGPAGRSKLDTAKVVPYTVGAAPYIFETAFFVGTKDNLDKMPVKFFPVNIGNIHIESGKVIACDPIVMGDAHPFAASFPTGSFPVQLSIAKIGFDERVAFSRILFSDSPVRKWEMATLPGQKPLSIYDTSFYGYGVDAGMGLFADSVSCAAFYKRGQQEWEKVFIKEPESHTRNTWSYNLYMFGHHSVACFSTGWGDGRYGSYIGYDRNGGVCQLLTDFNLVDWVRDRRKD